MASSKKTRILILGGGFAGLPAAIRLDDTLARDPEVAITLVNRDNFFLFTPMLHEVAAARKQAEEWLAPLQEHLADAGLGHISEIFDGDAPHRPVGCIARRPGASQKYSALQWRMFAVFGRSDQPLYSTPSHRSQPKPSASGPRSRKH